MWCLRWGLKPTYGFLERIDEAEAIAQIESLRFSGYVRLQATPPAS